MSKSRFGFGRWDVVLFALLLVAALAEAFIEDRMADKCHAAGGLWVRKPGCAPNTCEARP